MEPNLPHGARVEVSPRQIYLPGDVIAFASTGGSLRVHRVLGYRWHASGLALVTKGDQSPSIDAPVPAEHVVGLVRGGDCAAAIYQVPLLHRLVAFGYFVWRSLAWCYRHWVGAS
jgi:hypothetical protein